MKYIYEVMNWVSGDRFDTFTRYEELLNIDLEKYYVIVFKGEQPNVEVMRIMNDDQRDAWVVARERDIWVQSKSLMPHWDPFVDTDIQVKTATKEEVTKSNPLIHFKFIILYFAGIVQMMKHGKKDDTFLEKWFNQL